MGSIHQTLHLSFNSPELPEPKILRFKQLGSSRLIIFEDPSNDLIRTFNFQISKSILEMQCPKTLKLLCDFEKHFSILKKKPYCLSEGGDYNSWWMGVFGSSDEIRLAFFQSDIHKGMRVPIQPAKTGSFWIKGPEKHKKTSSIKGTPSSFGSKFSKDLHHIVSDLVAINAKFNFQI